MKKVLLIISGGIAAYKSLELIRLLKQSYQISVRCVLTEAGSHFVTPLSLTALSGDKVFSDLFSPTDEQFGHIQLSRSADLVVVAPATADIIAKLTTGLANDLASTLLLATDKPVVLAPSMNVKMWEHPATQDNISRLSSRGTHIIQPEEGDLACGEQGTGRMAGPEVIAAEINRLIVGINLKPLKGLKAIITTGATQEMIDPVRYISNHSSGRQGYSIAESLAFAGADVTVVSGKTNVVPPNGLKVVHALSAIDMLQACEKLLPADIFVGAAAVADWRLDKILSQKIKKTAGTDKLQLNLVKNPDIISLIGHLRDTIRPKLVVGFAAETDDLVSNASRKRLEKNCNWVVANFVYQPENVFDNTHNTVTFITEKATESWPRMNKKQVADRLVARIVEFFKK